MIEGSMLQVISVYCYYILKNWNKLVINHS